MSAIWGYINFKGASSDSHKLKECREKMTGLYEGCVIDKYGHKEFEKGFFSCGLQIFNDRAKNEDLPICDDKTIFTADIILNARDLLIKEISGYDEYKDVDLEKMPDGRLAFIAWKIWKTAFIDHIQGIFAIAIYETDTNKFYLFTDHLGHRCIYYLFTDTEVYFSTLARPIIHTAPKEYLELSEKWIVACESNSSPAMYMFPGLTPFESIRQLPCRSYIVASIGKDGKLGCKETVYWNPVKGRKKRIIQPPKGQDRTEFFRELFRKTFAECVADAIDTNKEVSTTLSGGLDSTSISCFASMMLKEKNKNLYSFTSIPIPEYKGSPDKSLIADESSKVMLFCRKYDNIVPEFLSCENKSAFTEMDRIVDISEIPSKALMNLVWIDEIYEKASQKGCNVLLFGQYGNGTISSGEIVARVYQEMLAGHFWEAKKQLAIFGKKYRVSKKELIRGCKSVFIPLLKFKLNLDFDYGDKFDSKYLKPGFLKKYDIIKYQRMVDRKEGYNQVITRDQAAEFMLDMPVSQNVNTYDTKFGLHYGVINRDPSKDKRMIELLMAMPDDQFTDDGIERRLIRKYLDDLIPDEIRMEVFRRGRQSADLVDRLNKTGKPHIDKDPSSGIYSFFDYDNVMELFEGEIKEENSFDILRIMSLESFFKWFEREKG